MGSFAQEISGLLSLRGDELAAVRSVKGLSDRVDAITMLVRSALRASSLCYVDGVLHHYDGRLYRATKKESVLADLSNVLVDLGFSPTDIRKMGEMPLSVVVERSFSRDPSLLCFDNCVVSLGRNGALASSGFSPVLIVTERMGYAYDPGARCPLWEAFLSEVLPEASVRMVLQEFFGMCYLDRSLLSVEKFALLVGTGANGKSVIFEVMKAVLGADNVSTFDSQQLTNEKMIPYVEGRRLNFAPDMKRSSDFDSALKALASGQEVAGRRIYGDAQKVKCPPLCFALNEMPRFRDTTDAFFRRVIPFHFAVTIPAERQDKKLVSKIVATCLPGIFNWVMEGRDRLIRSGGEFTPSPETDAYLSALRVRIDERQSPVRSYLASRGLSVYPRYENQPFVKVSQREIMAALGDISPTAVTREMNRYGVAMHRSREIFYRVYEL